MRWAFFFLFPIRNCLWKQSGSHYAQLAATRNSLRQSPQKQTANRNDMSKRSEIHKEYYKQFGTRKGASKVSEHYVKWLEDQVLKLRMEKEQHEAIKVFTTAC